MKRLTKNFLLIQIGYEQVFHLDKVFTISREVVDKQSNEILVKANYDDLDNLLISLIIITLVVPIITIYVIQKTKFKSTE